MSEHVTTRSIGAIASYYSNNKNKSLRDRKSYAKNDIDNDFPVEDEIDNDGGANLKQTLDLIGIFVISRRYCVACRIIML